MQPDETLLSEFSPGMSLEEVQAEYQDRLYNSMAEYMQSARSVVINRNEFNRSINDAFTFAFLAGWTDAGASALTQEAQAWLNSRIQQEVSFAVTLFGQLKELRADDTIPLEDKLTACQSHAEAYTNTLVGVAAQGKAMGDPERDGRWEYGGTEQHCSTCQMLNGKVKPLSWYIDNEYIPQQAGSPTLECGGFNCLCTVVDPKSGEQILP